MIKFSTVLVLGAGASAPYGFPSGDRLVDLICKHLTQPSSLWSERLREVARLAGKDLADPCFNLENFHKSLRNSKLKSIDRFVQRREEYLELGKYAIAQELIVREMQPRLYPINRPERPKDWYRTLFNEILPPKSDDLASCNLKIITFNFDRSFERALYLALEATYTYNDAALLAKKIPILHVHGQLGLPTWLPPEEHHHFYRDYTPTIDAHKVLHSAGAIKLSHQEVGPVMNKARQWLSETERVCFLGFGFDDLNLDRLDIPQSVSGKSVWSTRLGIASGPLSKVQRRFETASVNHFWQPLDWDIVKFLDENPLIHGA